MTDNSESSPVGPRIVVAREHQGWSQEELARRVGVTIDTIKAWEAGERDPRANRLFTLAGILSVTPHWLLEGRVEDFATADTVAPADAAKAKLAAARRKLQEAMTLVDEVEGQLDDL